MRGRVGEVRAGNLASQGPSGAYGVGWMRRRGRVPDGLPEGSPDVARNATVTGVTFAGHQNFQT